jgi:radical SAM superfamily enzyme YgiQ (UPF0313 family)
MAKNKKILLGATHSVIEPLGLLHLSTIAKEEGYETKVTLAKRNFMGFDDAVKEFEPSLVGFTVYTGNHSRVFDYLDTVRHRYNIKVVVGGPHATYFPKESLEHADWVVLSEGFDSFRRILQGKAAPGIVPLIWREKFPPSDREDFYKENKEYDTSPIKSIIASTGCPFSCTYCYNSSTIKSLEGILDAKQMADMSSVLDSKRLFPKSLRSVDEIIAEVKEIRRVSPQTKMIYFQDDVFGTNSEWTKEFANKYKKLNLPFHAQMRFEYANPNISACKERLDLLRDAGCTGLTFAIESASPIIREEVLNRKMGEDLIFDTMDYLNFLGYKVRTEQMLGLPYGATSKETPINLDADLETLAFNVKLRKETGLPTMAWASIFAPYRGTAIGEYCRKHGFYHGGNDDVPETFFQRSVLRFPKQWIGPELVTGMNDAWLQGEDQNKYRDDMQLLRDLFSYFAMIPEGDKLAERFIKSKDHSYISLSKNTRHHLYDEVLYK